MDFPIYRKNPHVPKWGWIVLFIALVIGFIFRMGSSMYSAILACAIPLIPLLYFLKWDYGAIFQKPKLSEVGLALALFVGYMVYALLVASVLDSVGITGGDLIDSTTITLMSLPPLIFSLMGEELLKFIPFVFFMRLSYKYSNNRKFSTILSVLIVTVFFASLHAFDLNTFMFALVVQGFGSIFEFFGYIKTKNILISYITHLCTDVFILSLAIMGLLK